MFQKARIICYNFSLRVEFHVLSYVTIKLGLIRTLNCWNNGLKNEEIRRGLVLKQKGIRTVGGLLGELNSTKGARKENGRWLLEKRDASIGSRLYKALPKEGVQAMKERAKIYAKTRKDQGDILNIDTELNSVLPYKEQEYEIRKTKSFPLNILNTESPNPYKEFSSRQRNKNVRVWKDFEYDADDYSQQFEEWMTYDELDDDLKDELDEARTEEMEEMEDQLIFDMEVDDE